MTDTLIWISGASAGIGRALVETQPYPDAHVVDISRSGGTAGAEHLPADLAEPASWSAVEAHLEAQLGAFDGARAIFVHNAGTLEPMGFAGEVDSDAYRAQVLLNAAAPQVLGHAFVRAARGFDGDAHLVMLTSGAATSPYEGWSAYCAGKAAVDMWVRTVGAEQAQRGSRVRVVAVAPGVVATAMQEQIRAMDEADFPKVARFRDLHARGALRDPAEAARGIWRVLERDVGNGAVVDLRQQ
jgi:benzil reductase ((S)-benzoin forming)